MKRQRGVVLLLALTLSLLLALLAAQSLREALLQQRLMAEQLALAQAFEQAEASLIEAAAALRTAPSPCLECQPPALPVGEPGSPWQANESGYVLLQNLGQSTRAAGLPTAEPVLLVRITAISRQSRGRQALEAVYALSDPPTRLSWRQRLAQD